MTGLPEYNHPAFFAAEAKLQMQGHFVVNPARNKVDHNGKTDEQIWQAYMRISVTQVAHVNAVFMLAGWEKSKGARLEYDIAKALGLEIWEQWD